MVDDNELTSAGFAAGLGGCANVELVATLDHAQALSWADHWQQIDVVLVDAADEELSGDQFPGVQVVARIRACQGDRRPSVVVVTGHFLNDGLRHRMADADADLFFLRSDLRTFTTLRDVVLHPENYRRGVPDVSDPEARRVLGITAESQVEELVRYVEDNDLAEALHPTHPCRVDPRSRRWLRHRRQIADVARIDPVNLTTGQAPTRRQLSPSLRQLGSIYRWAAKVHQVDERRSRDD